MIVHTPYLENWRTKTGEAWEWGYISGEAVATSAVHELVRPNILFRFCVLYWTETEEQKRGSLGIRLYRSSYTSAVPEL